MRSLFAFFVLTVLIIRIIFLTRLEADSNNLQTKKSLDGNPGLGGFVTFTLYLSSEYLNKDIGNGLAVIPTAVVSSVPVASAAEAKKIESAEQLRNKDTVLENKATVKPESKNITSTTAIEDTEPASIGLPRRLLIPSLGIDANVQYVGLTASGAMSVPDNSKDVAWFKPGVRPGQIGNAVIAGHLDSAKDAPAVFWNLRKLEKKSDVYIIDDNNIRWQFKVVGSELYDESNGSTESVFGRSDKARLNLITCDGVWDKEKNNYSKRLVVFTEAL